MFESLFGAEMPLAVRFFLAFLIVLGLIGATAWAVRRFGSGRLGGSSARGRQPRLAVIDYATVDARRRLILVRRDNVEHLLMIGGPTDVVVEPNIVRAVAAPRDAGVARLPMAEPPRAIPLPDNGLNGSNGAAWPLQPEPATQRPTPRAEPAPAPEEAAAWPLQPQPEPLTRPQRDTLTALADELTPRPAPQRGRPLAAPRPVQAEPRAPAAPAQPAPAEAAGSTDQSLAEMAHRLEAALRKPGGAAEAREPRPQAARPAPAAEHAAEHEAAPPPSPAPQRPRSAEARPQRAEPKPQAGAPPNQAKTLYDSLEQEMASLLGRPPTKT